jgi:hypothetical protein
MARRVPEEELTEVFRAELGLVMAGCDILIFSFGKVGDI